MRINRIFIDSFRNLKKFDLAFQGKHHTAVLLGKNGTGKSNLMEAISIIFQSIYSANSERNLFIPMEDSNEYLKYRLEYECGGNQIIIDCVNSPIIISIKEKGQKNYTNVKLSYLKNKDSLKQTYRFIPQFIIGYYSGVSTRFSDIFQEVETAELEKLKKNKGDNELLRPLFFVRNYHSNILLLVLNLIRKRNKAADEILKNYIGVAEINTFSLTLKSPRWNLDSGKPISLNDGLNLFWGANGNAHKFLNLLESFKEDSLLDVNASGKKGIKDERYTLLFNTKKARKDLLEYLGSGINFFRALETILLAGFVDRIDFTIEKGPNLHEIEYAKLSEGEQQLLAVLALLILTDDYETIYLLDEPDTHLNPNWQREYVKLLRKSDHHKRNSQIILSTHSPLILQAANDAEIVLMRKAKKGYVDVNLEDYTIKNWRIDQVYASEYFDFFSTRPPALDRYMRIRDRLLSKTKLTKADIKRIKENENEFGILPSGETLDDFKAMRNITLLSKQNSVIDGKN